MSPLWLSCNTVTSLSGTFMTYQVGEPYPLLEGDTDEGDEAATNALVRCLLVLTPAISRTVPRRRPRPLRSASVLTWGSSATAGDRPRRILVRRA
jgi:hypothetical protein